MESRLGLQHLKQTGGESPFLKTNNMKTAIKLKHLKDEMLEIQNAIDTSFHWSIKERDSGNEDRKEFLLFQMRIEQAILESLENIFDEVLNELN